MLVNCQSICSLTKRQNLMKLCTMKNIAILFLSETWLNSDIRDSEIFLGSSFSVAARSDRQRSQHGGVLIGISNTTRMNVIDFSIHEFDFTVSCLIVDAIPSLFVLLYKPPFTSNYGFRTEILIDCLYAYSRKFSDWCSTRGYLSQNIQVLGDFNLPGIDWDCCYSSNPQESLFIEAIMDLELMQLVEQPTHKCGKILDLVLSNRLDISASVEDVPFSDHFPIFFGLKLCEPPLDPQSNFSVSSFSPLDFNQHIGPLYELLTNDILLNPNFPSEFYNNLIHVVHASAKKKA